MTRGTADDNGSGNARRGPRRGAGVQRTDQEVTTSVPTADGHNAERTAGNTARGRNRGNSGNRQQRRPRPNHTGNEPELDLTVKKFDFHVNADDVAGNEVCYICAEHMRYRAVGVCNHAVCHVCNLRLRALYKNNACTLCKVQEDIVIFTSDMKTPFEDFKLSNMKHLDEKLGIYFETAELKNLTLQMLLFNCPVASCDVVCDDGWKSLKAHARNKHGRYLCDLCIKNKKVFVHEQDLFTTSELTQHNKSGDPKDQSFKGHPFCIFCRRHFYDHERLFEHCREAHEKCYLCNDQFQYYKDFQALQKHMTEAHFRCTHTACAEDQFAYFKTEEELLEHRRNFHDDILSIRGKIYPGIDPRQSGISIGGISGTSSQSRNGRPSREPQRENTKKQQKNNNSNHQSHDDNTLGKLPKELYGKIEALLDYSPSAIRDMNSVFRDYLSSRTDSDKFISEFMDIVLRKHSDAPDPEASKQKGVKEREIDAGKIWREIAFVIPESNLRSTNSGKKKHVETMDLYNVTYQDILRAWSDWKSSIADARALAEEGSSSSVNAADKPTWVARNDGQRNTARRDDFFPALPGMESAGTTGRNTSSYKSAAAVAKDGARFAASRKLGSNGRTVVGSMTTQHTLGSAPAIKRPDVRSGSPSVGNAAGSGSSSTQLSINRWITVAPRGSAKFNEDFPTVEVPSKDNSSNGFAALNDSQDIDSRSYEESDRQARNSRKGKNVEDFPSLPLEPLSERAQRKEAYFKNKAKKNAAEEEPRPSSANLEGYTKLVREEPTEEEPKGRKKERKQQRQKQYMAFF